jgi:hypothetical protein
MTTSVYLHLDVCPHCGRSDNYEGLHVGQSASGFHGYLAEDPQLPAWWDERPIATLADWTKFALEAVRRGALWSDNNGNRLADPATTVADALCVIGYGESQADYMRRHGPGSGSVVWHTEVDVANLPGYCTPRADRLFWIADEYTFTTGGWS